MNQDFLSDVEKYGKTIRILICHKLKQRFSKNKTTLQISGPKQYTIIMPVLQFRFADME